MRKTCWGGHGAEYWRIYYTVTEMMRAYGLEGTDSFISSCVERIQQDAGEDWNEDDVRIAIQNTLNELIEKMSAQG